MEWNVRWFCGWKLARIELLEPMLVATHAGNRYLQKVWKIYPEAGGWVYVGSLAYARYYICKRIMTDHEGGSRR